MTTATKRKKLLDFVSTADDKKVKEVYSTFENDIAENMQAANLLTQKQKMDMLQQAAKDPLFLADLKEISDDFAIADSEKV